jgi:hypothetical protein
VGAFGVAQAGLHGTFTAVTALLEDKYDDGDANE